MVEEQICQLYGNPKEILSDGDPKFDSAAIKDYGSSASVNWKIVSASNHRGSAKVERMVGNLKRTVQKIVISNSIETRTRILERYSVDTEDDSVLMENLLSKCFSEYDPHSQLSHTNLTWLSSIPIELEKLKLPYRSLPEYHELSPMRQISEQKNSNLDKK